VPHLVGHLLTPVLLWLGLAGVAARGDVEVRLDDVSEGGGEADWGTGEEVDGGTQRGELP
jgi:hypothetical protein